MFVMYVPVGYATPWQYGSISHFNSPLLRIIFLFPYSLNPFRILCFLLFFGSTRRIIRLIRSSVNSAWKALKSWHENRRQV